MLFYNLSSLIIVTGRDCGRGYGGTIMIWGESFLHKVRKSDTVGLVIAVVFVLLLCILGAVGIALVNGFHLAGG